MGTPELAAGTGLSDEQALEWLPHILEAAHRFDFTEPKRLAMWLAQCGHESQGFRRLAENLNYKAAALTRTWPSRFPTPQVAESYAHQPERIANRVYGGRMGNGPADSGDGWRFRGRGLIQLTGRANYKACGAGLDTDLVAEPDLLAGRRFAALSAGWFWDSRKLNVLADAGDVGGVTKKINGGTLGLTERTALYHRALGALA